jgi:hypothetical protein
MKRKSILRPLAISLMTGFLLASVPAVHATVFRDDSSSFWEKRREQEIEKEKERAREREKYRRDDKKPNSVPEGSSRALLILAAGALGGSVVVWRRKQRANVS